jgi:GT2 family glycosyltransferase
VVSLINSIEDSCSETLRYEVIVVDNASSDDTVDWLRKDYPEITLLPNKENVGFGRANNQAAKIAKGKFLFFLNPDTIIQSDTLEIMWKRLTEDQTIAGIGCQIRSISGQIAPESKRRFPSVRNIMSKALSADKLGGWPVDTSYYDRQSLRQNSMAEVLSGCCMMLRKNTFLQIGGFDEQFFLFGEDVDLCRRLYDQGHQLAYTADTHITHLKGQSTRQNEGKYLWHFYKSAYLYAVKHHRRSDSPTFKMMIASGALIHGFTKFIRHKLSQSKKMAIRLFM